MAKLPLDVCQGLPRLDQETREGVAEDVGFAVAQGRPFEKAGPHVSPERVVTDWLTYGSREDTLRQSDTSKDRLGLPQRSMCCQTRGKLTA
jgi:hypothetical protein